MCLLFWMTLVCDNEPEIMVHCQSVTYVSNGNFVIIKTMKNRLHLYMCVCLYVAKYVCSDYVLDVFINACVLYIMECCNVTR